MRCDLLFCVADLERDKEVLGVLGRGKVAGPRAAGQRGKALKGTTKKRRAESGREGQGREE